MKIVATGIGFLAIQLGALGQGVFIGPGSYQVFVVPSLTYIRPATPLEGESTMTIHLGSDRFDAGETISFDYSSKPITNGMTGGIQLPRPAGFPSTSVFSIKQWGPFWTSAPGYVLMGMVSGSIEVQSISVDHVINGGFYSDIVIVPEPGTAALFLLALVSGWWVIPHPQRNGRAEVGQPLGVPEGITASASIAKSAA